MTRAKIARVDEVPAMPSVLRRNALHPNVLLGNRNLGFMGRGGVRRNQSVVFQGRMNRVTDAKKLHLPRHCVDKGNGGKNPTIAHAVMQGGVRLNQRNGGKNPTIAHVAMQGGVRLNQRNGGKTPIVVDVTMQDAVHPNRKNGVKASHPPMHVRRGAREANGRNPRERPAPPILRSCLGHPIPRTKVRRNIRLHPPVRPPANRNGRIANALLHRPIGGVNAMNGDKADKGTLNRLPLLPPMALPKPQTPARRVGTVHAPDDRDFVWIYLT